MSDKFVSAVSSNFTILPSEGGRGEDRLCTGPSDSMTAYMGEGRDIEFEDFFPLDTIYFMQDSMNKGKDDPQLVFSVRDTDSGLIIESDRWIFPSNVKDN